MSIESRNGKNGVSQLDSAGEQAGEVLGDLAASPTAVNPIRSSLTMDLVQGCPHLGVMDDAETRFLFASPVGTCYRANPPGQVSLEHQQAHCLGQEHTTCPVYCAANPGALPEGVRLGAAPRTVKRRYWAAGTFVVLGLITAVVLLLSSMGAGSIPSSESPLATPFITAAVVALVPTTTPTTTATQTAVSTATQSPTSTPLPSLTSPPTAVPTQTLPPTFTSVALTVPATATPVPLPVPIASVSVRLLNVRSGPGIEYPVLAEVAEGATFDVTGQLGGWWQVCCIAGEPGWLIAEAVTVTGDASNVPVVRVTPVEE
jgi:hypothetical protein